MLNCDLYYLSDALSSTIINSIIICDGDATLDASNIAIKCLAVDEDENYFEESEAANYTKNYYSKDTSFFKDFDVDREENDYILTDEAAAKYLGDDGTQVGYYGGSLPYATTPNNPQISKFKVAGKSSADGKLSVEIEVTSPNYNNTANSISKMRQIPQSYRKFKQMSKETLKTTYSQIKNF